MCPQGGKQHPNSHPPCFDALPFSLGTQGPPEHCLGSYCELWLWTHVCLHQPVIRPSWISQGSDLCREESIMEALIDGIWLAAKSAREA